MDFFPSLELLNKFAPLKPIPQCNHLCAHQAEDVFALWDAWEEESGGERDIPYWAVVWPAGISLARYLLNNTHIVRGKSVLDIGCGGGIPAIAAVKAGSLCVTANDVDPVALYITSFNAKANDVTVTADYRNFLEKSATNNRYNIILAADIFYQRSDSKQMLDFLNTCRNIGSTILIADAQRTYAPKNNVSQLYKETIMVNKDLEGVEQRDVRLFLLND